MVCFVHDLDVDLMEYIYFWWSIMNYGNWYVVTKLK
jgi:hypothetical protein